MIESIQNQKKKMRAEFGALRQQFVSFKPVQLASIEILRHQTWFRKAKVVALYMPDRVEFPTKPLFELCRLTKKIVVAPVVETQNLIFLKLDEWPKYSGVEDQILEPHFGEKIDVNRIDLFVVPLVAFDRHGNRLGRNGGFYDRLFSNPLITATKVGVGFEFQNTLKVPVEAHDIAMDYILTEKKIFKAL